MSEEGSGSDEFVRRLSDLKREGANVLVSGTVPRDVHAAVCRDFLGGAEESRRRLLVLADRDSTGVDALLAPDHDRTPERLRVVDYGGGTRSAAGGTTGTTGLDGGRFTGAGAPTAGFDDLDPREDGGIPPGAIRTVGSEDLPGLGAAVTEAIDGFETVAGADGLAPAELRMCVDSLGPLVAEHGRSTVFRFLHLLTERVRRAAGLGSYHLPAPPDDESVAMLASLFDATVELRVEDGQPRQRWDLGDVRSEWLPVEDGPE